ncbi:MAG: hypothetical protein V5A16_03015 [Haloplanus sp.]
MSNGSDGSSLSRVQSYALVVAAAILLSAILAPVAYDRATAPDGTVAVISIEGSISSGTVTSIQEDLREARENESIDAVVLNVDSPGGAAAASEQLYLSVQRTAAEMPVVASVKSTGASGAYYAMLPASDIYVTPAPSSGASVSAVRRPVPRSPVRSGAARTRPARPPTSDARRSRPSSARSLAPS